MKKVAYLHWAKTSDEVNLGYNWIKKLPSFLKDQYILKNCPVKVEEVPFLETSFFEVQLPLTIEEANGKSERYLQKLMDRVMEILEEKKVKMICFSEKGKNKLYYSIPISKGDYVIPFFIYWAILKVAGRSLEDTEVTILDGKNKTTDLILDLIYPRVNYLNIISDETERFKVKSEEIYDDVGLNLQLLSHNKKTVLEYTDVIIDCRDIPHTDFYYCNKRAMYFYIGDNKEMVKNILIKCPDLKVIDDFILSVQGKQYSTAFCEMIWFASKEWFDLIVSKEYTLGDLKQIHKEIVKDGWKVENFCRYGNIV
ncbi:hypothetical protein GND95_03615 [Defluviitalea raffinosedens]|uniref:Uncharacterized protein n=1 Tax=Defluviitalea raffinosedens TaxID=1450156 RepID=A0A7C8LJ27_9FIRM|nr:hypothetical protein [Defluviitalea raffinosedens]KAE9636218.1 hypothetical protein GND95_03615 [Defluviitalea raffinosedens]